MAPHGGPQMTRREILLAAAAGGMTLRGVELETGRNRPCGMDQLAAQPDGRFPPDDRAHRTALMSAQGRRQLRTEISAQFLCVPFELGLFVITSMAIGMSIDIR